MSVTIRQPQTTFNGL